MSNHNKIEILLEPENITLIKSGDMFKSGNRTEYDVPFKFINENGKWYIELKDTKLYCVHEFIEETSARSSPAVNLFIFSTEDKREQFIEDWIEEKESGEYLVGDEHYFKGNYSYHYERLEVEIDKYNWNGLTLKEY